MYKNEDIISIENLNTSFKLKWRLTGWCNFHCSYCSDKDNKSSWLTEEQIIENAKKIDSLLKEPLINKKVRLNLIGGEICYYNLIKVLEQFKNLKLVSVSVTTNFSQSLDYYIELLNWFKNHNIHYILTCSEHPEAINFDAKFKYLSIWCKKNGYNLPRRSKVVESLNDLDIKSEKYIHLERNASNKINSQEQNEKLIANISKFESEHNKKNYKVTLKDEILYFTSVSHFLAQLDNDGLEMKNLECTSGVDNLLINWDGNIMLNQCTKLNTNIIGNINDKSIELPKQNYICNGPDRCPICNGVSIYKH